VGARSCHSRTVRSASLARSTLALARSVARSLTQSPSSTRQRQAVPATRGVGEYPQNDTKHTNDRCAALTTPLRRPPLRPPSAERPLRLPDRVADGAAAEGGAAGREPLALRAYGGALPDHSRTAAHTQGAAASTSTSTSSTARRARPRPRPHPAHALVQRCLNGSLNGSLIGSLNGSLNGSLRWTAPCATTPCRGAPRSTSAPDWKTTSPPTPPGNPNPSLD
jgi:hypothetical protein